jgi:hypothetical protein
MPEPQQETFSNVQPLETFSNIQPVSQAAPTSEGWLGKFASEFWNQVNPVSAVQGVSQAFYHPIETAKSMGQAQGALAQKAEDAFHRGEYVEGLRHSLSYLIPILGPQIDRAADLMQQQEYAKGLGATTGIAANIAAPEAAGAVRARLPVGPLPEAVYRSVMKPSTTFSLPERAQMVATGLEEGIPISPKGVDKLWNLVSDLDGKVKAIVSSRPGDIDPYQVAARTQQTAQKFATQVTPRADVGAINDATKEFLEARGEITDPATGQIVQRATPMSAEEALALKKGTYQQLKGKYGELSAARVEAEKALARGIKEELETKFPEIAGLNERESRLIGLDQALEQAVKRIQNRELFGLTAHIVTGSMPIAGAVVGGAPGLAAGAAAGLLSRVINDPMLQSKMAIALNRAGKGVAMPTAIARIGAYSNALGQAANAAQTSQLTPPTER